MKIKQRIFDQLLTRLNEIVVPDNDVDPLIWNRENADCAFDELEITSVDIQKDSWQYVIQYQGNFRVSLLLDQSSEGNLDFDPFIENLINTPIHLLPNPDAVHGEASEKAHVQLLKLRESMLLDSLHGNHRKIEFMFSVNAYLMRKIAAVEAPEVWIGESPEVGLEHVDKYVKLV